MVETVSPVNETWMSEVAEVSATRISAFEVSTNVLCWSRIVRASLPADIPVVADACITSRCSENTTSTSAAVVVRFRCTEEEEEKQKKHRREKMK